MVAAVCAAGGAPAPFTGTGSFSLPSALAVATTALGVLCMLGALSALGLRSSMASSSFPESEPDRAAAGWPPLLPAEAERSAACSGCS